MFFTRIFLCRSQIMSNLLDRSNQSLSMPNYVTFIETFFSDCHEKLQQRGLL
jgi:hypothetical protein